MSTAVFITMTTDIMNSEDENETYVFQTKGTMKEMKSAYYLRFDEIVEEAGTVHNTFKIENERLTVLRQGPLSMRQQLEVGQVTDGVYRTPFGTLPFSVEAKDILFSWDEATHIGRLDYTYLMKLGSPVARRHRVTIEMKGVPEK